jgi:hypothetical protein
MLSEFLVKALEMGCDEIEIECKDRNELITASRGSLGLGIGCVSTKEAGPLLETIRELKRRKRVMIGGTSYRVTISTYESFAEWAHRIQLKEIAAKSASKKKR